MFVKARANYSVIEEFETRTVRARMCSDRIVRVTFKAKAVITLELNRENFEVYKKLSKGKLFPFLFDAEEYVTITSEARKDAIDHEGEIPQTCVAVVVNNIAYKLIADFYKKFHKPSLPYDVFSNYSKAETWCLKLLQEQDEQEMLQKFR